MKNYAFFEIFATLLILVASTVARPTAEQNDQSNMDERGPYFGGDVILPQGMDPYNGIVGDFLRWPNKTLIYALDQDFTESELSIISEAMREIENKTCIKFQPRESEIGYVFVARGLPDSGCFSLLGHVGTAQQLNLEPAGETGSTCITKGIAMHEMLHAIGFLHEQSREDRDDYVSVNWDNVEVGTEFNFVKATATLTYNVTYDYGSLMHYSKYSFAKDPTVPTLVPLDPAAEIGQRQRLSEKDIYKVNAMYCPENNGEIPFL